MKINLVGIVVGLGLPLPAFAAAPNLRCDSADQTVHFGLRHVQTQRVDALAVLERDATQTGFAGILLTSEVGQIYSKSIYKLFGYEQEDATLTVVSRQTACGRGGCIGPLEINANFKQSQVVTAFTCHEETP